MSEFALLVVEVVCWWTTRTGQHMGTILLRWSLIWTRLTHLFSK